MHWLTRIFERIGLTRNEAYALLACSLLFGTGLVARQVQYRAVRVPVGAYDEMDRLFFERSAALDSARSVRELGAVRAAPDSLSRAASVTANSERPQERLPSESFPTAVESPAAPPGRTPAQSLRVDVNTAGLAELEALPRIGPRMAERIVAFRSTYGPFRSVEDLAQIRGIGQATVELLKPHVFFARADSS